MPVQTTFTVNPDVGFPGMIAEPASPTRIERGVLTVPSGATRANPRPGDSLYYNTTANGWQVPVNAADQLLVSAILSYRQDDVAGTDAILQYSNDDEIQIITMGVVWVIAGGASERGQNLVMQFDDWKYDNTARVTAVTDMHIVPITSFNVAVAADTNIIKAAIGYGRVL